MYAGSKLESTASFTTRDCIEAFSLLHGKLVESGSPFNVQMPLGGLEDEIGRFRIWAGNMGALQRGHSSLDYRLRDADLLHENILKLLKELKGTLSEGLHELFSIGSLLIERSNLRHLWRETSVRGRSEKRQALRCSRGYIAIIGGQSQ